MQYHKNTAPGNGKYFGGKLLYCTKSKMDSFQIQTWISDCGLLLNYCSSFMKVRAISRSAFNRIRKGINYSGEGSAGVLVLASLQPSMFTCALAVPYMYYICTHPHTKDLQPQIVQESALQQLVQIQIRDYLYI